MTCLGRVTVKRQRRTTFEKFRTLIKAGETIRVINARAQEAENHPAIKEFINHCRSDLHRMRHHECKRRGIPRGDGLIEGGCRSVVVDRLKKSGSRWSVKGANAIMAIRCCRMNSRATDLFNWCTATYQQI